MTNGWPMDFRNFLATAIAMSVDRLVQESFTQVAIHFGSLFRLSVRENRCDQCTHAGYELVMS